jgi:hypothetical protein
MNAMRRGTAIDAPDLRRVKCTARPRKVLVAESSLTCVIREPCASARRVPRIGRRGRAAALFVMLGSFAILGACADEHAAQSGSTARPGEKADIVGGGGRLDEIYRGIYSPGNPRWSDF